MTETLACKICGAPSPEAFRIPKSKKTGHPIPDLPDDCPYYECSRCGFCFSTLLDTADHTEIYDESYWVGQDPDWYGRVSETLRLALLANQLAQRPPDRLEILDFGCGMGTFVETCRRNLQLDAWGTDIIKPKFGADYFLPKVDRKFDIVVACEVMEHIPTPVETFRAIRGMLKPGGVFAFQTAEYDHVNGRDWWYVGPDNGHISLYSRGAFDSLFKQLGGCSRLMWREYPGVQAWQFDKPHLGADEGRFRALEEQLAAVHRSTSWRVTAPLRSIGNIFRRAAAATQILNQNAGPSNNCPAGGIRHRGLGTRIQGMCGLPRNGACCSIGQREAGYDLAQARANGCERSGSDPAGRPVHLFGVAHIDRLLLRK